MEIKIWIHLILSTISNKEQEEKMSSYGSLKSLKIKRVNKKEIIQLSTAEILIEVVDKDKRKSSTPVYDGLMV